MYPDPMSSTYKSDAIVQAIINRQPVSMSQIPVIAGEYIDVKELMNKYSNYVNMYVDKLKSQNTSEPSCTAWTAKLVVVCLAALAYFVFVIKAKKTIKNRRILAQNTSIEVSQNESMEDSEDEEWVITEVDEHTELRQDYNDDINFGKL